MKIAIFEDERYNLRLLEGMIRALRPGWEVVQTFESVKGSVAWLRENPHPSLFFMDIQLADGLCFSIFDQVEVKAVVIFTTAYDEYALRAFQVNSIDYLLKPFKEKDLLAAIEKFERFRELLPAGSSGHDYSGIVEDIRDGKKRYRKRFLVSRGPFLYKLDVEEVAYFESENHVTTAVTFNDHKQVIDFSLDRLEEELDPDLFFRVNRQIILNVEAIKKIENYFGGKLKVKVIPSREKEVAVSRLKANAFKGWVGK